MTFLEDSKNNSPRPVKYWECCIAVIRKRISEQENNGVTTQNSAFITDLFGSLNEPQKSYLSEAFDLYKQINKNHYPEYSFDETSIYQIFPQKKENENQSADPLNKTIDEIGVFEINVDTKNRVKKPKIAFANSEVIISNIVSSLRGKPDLNKSRYSALQKTFKATREANADILLFPENYLPYEMLESLARFSAKNETLSVSGLEHWTAFEVSYNFIVTIIPVEINDQKDAVVVIRLKNHYSPDEIEMIKGERLLVPKPKQFRYDIFNWRNLYFSPYYCFELADSIHRSIFRSKIDLLIASEWNKDTPYFSNIVESITRDVHAYVAQVNTSQYGDSRLTQPTKSATKDLLKLKGGKNDTILVGEIDIDKLREFQRVEHNVSKVEQIFKPLPPDYDNENAIKRINNKSVIDKG